MLPIRIISAPVRVCGATLKFVSHGLQLKNDQSAENQRILDVSAYASPITTGTISEGDHDTQEPEAGSARLSSKSFWCISGIDIMPAVVATQDPAKRETPADINIQQGSSTNVRGPITSQISVGLLLNSIRPQGREWFSSVSAYRNHFCSKLNLKPTTDLSPSIEGERLLSNIGLTPSVKNWQRKNPQESPKENYEEEKSDKVEGEKKSVRRRRRRRKGNSNQQTSKPDVGSSSQSSFCAAVSKSSTGEDSTGLISVEWTSADGTKKVAHTFDEVCSIFNPGHIARNADGSIKTLEKRHMSKNTSQGSSSNSKPAHSNDKIRQSEASKTQECSDGAASSYSSCVPRAAKQIESRKIGDESV